MRWSPSHDERPAKFSKLGRSETISLFPTFASMTSSNPIGVFDSGIGGMTLARAVNDILPAESIVYFGDTAHLPYGDKSAAAIQAYSVKICNVLLQRNCKVILIACNSASSAAYELIKEYVGSRAKVINVIDPVVEYIGQHFEGRRVGVIGTRQTIHSNVYTAKIEGLNKSIQVASLATPLLASMIEEGFFNNSISKNVIEEYLGAPELQQIDALILGCTHYPLIKNEISEYYEGSVEVIDSSTIVAKALKAHLLQNELLNTGLGDYDFYVSDFTESFKASTQLFFRREVPLQHYPLWE